ncbi:Protoheme IX farnesyltransferase [Oceanibacterium hippocampi]|uniref:Protoheme IX farnesyltransferase n=1 Tax=Oceanibacterium hippocampi TaxID=745714 RepID=A0A1Y5S9S8_9PROT|nr:heme o synthase [Oceanibacterium hippocampi]SLN33250.1 Protoheme IX farnesyltransferase [Oceanibacterium hippocampi]
MTDTTAIAADKTDPADLARVGDYFALLKPRVMSLVIFTAGVGLAIAPGDIHPLLAFTALLAIAVGAGASGAINMWYDADIDRVMARTRNRPIPAGRIDAGTALAFGSVLAVGSVIVMGLAVNHVAALLLAVTIAFYVFIYTMWLKRRTPQNIVIGGASGALPPVIGWAAVTGTVDAGAVALFAIIFMWTPPHFWALSLWRSGDYEKVGVPMLPVVAGLRATRNQILVYSLLLFPITLTPPFFGAGGWFYEAVAAVLGLVFVFAAFRVWRSEEEKPAKQLFAYSILYLFLLFAALLGEWAFGRVA